MIIQDGRVHGYHKVGAALARYYEIAQRRRRGR